MVPTRKQFSEKWRKELPSRVVNRKAAGGSLESMFLLMVAFSLGILELPGGLVTPLLLSCDFQFARNFASGTLYRAVESLLDSLHRSYPFVACDIRHEAEN